MLFTIAAGSLTATAQEKPIEYCRGGKFVVGTDTVSVNSYMASLDTLPVHRQVKLREKALEAIKMEATRRED